METGLDKIKLIAEIIAFPVLVAGIVIHETDETIMIGEIETALDNPELKEFGYTFPKYRYVMTLLKKNIVNRQDFEIKE